jgi:uncharacterized protein (TIRG00374 family)
MEYMPMTASYSRSTDPLPIGQPASKEADIQPVETLQQRRKETRKKLLKFFVRAGITLLIFTFLLRSFSWSTFAKTLAHVHHIALLMGLAVGMLCVVFSAYSWQSLLKAERIHLDLAKLINLYFIGMAFSHFLPTSMGGDAVKAFYVGREFNNTAGATSAVVLSRVVGFVGMLLIAIPSLLIWSAYFTHEVLVGFLLFSLIVIIAIAGAIILSICLPRLSAAIQKSKRRIHPLLTTTLEISCALGYTIRRPRALIIAIVFAMLFWVASILNYYGYASALGMDAPLYGYVIAVSFSSLVAALPISINGFGVRESAFVYVFSMLHVSPATSLLLAFLMDAQVLFFGILGGCMYLTMNTHKKRLTAPSICDQK